MSGMRKGLLLLLSAVSLPAAEIKDPTLVWPTPHPGFSKGESFASWVQPTVSGDPLSGLFGCVRNDGRRFHEGLDITPYLKRERGEATDGRYVVIEHDQLHPRFITLYAHLKEVRDDLKVGARVPGGTRIGTMGRSAGGYHIPRSRAHLHFEMGLLLTEDFQTWYDAQRFGSPNRHSLYNGMNLVGWDPLDYYEKHRDGRVSHSLDYLGTLAPGFAVQVRSSVVPDFVRRYPELLTRFPDARTAGWTIVFTGWGLPVRFTPQTAGELADWTESGNVRLTAINPEAVEKYACRRMVESGEVPRPGSGLRRILDLLFGPAVNE